MQGKERRREKGEEQNGKDGKSMMILESVGITGWLLHPPLCGFLPFSLTLIIFE